MGGARCQHRRARARRVRSTDAHRTGSQGRLNRFVVLALVVACGGKPPPDDDLAAYLTHVATLEPVARVEEVRSWRPSEAAWRELVVDPYRDVYAEYARAFDSRVPAIASRITGSSFSTRAHYADDPKLTAEEARIRWALPVAFASQVARASGSELEVVFIRDGHRWIAISDLDMVIRPRVAALDPACTFWLALDNPPPRCHQITFEIADAALRNSTARFTHACALAATLCGKPSP